MPVTIVAELSGNHLGKKADAISLLCEARAAGADAVKLQTFKPEELAVDNPDYTTLTSGLWNGRTLLDLYRETYLPWEWHAELFAVAKDLGLQCFSSPFHPSAVDFLESLGCPQYKVASFEIGDGPLLERIAATRKPVIVSTGVATSYDIERALAVLDPSLVTLLHCVSEYPAAPHEMNLQRMVDLGIFAVPRVGLSDHSLTPTAAVCATALGAAMIEKHLCLDRSLGGPDAGFSLEPDEFGRTVRLVREAEAAMARPPTKEWNPSGNYVALRKSLWVVKKVRKGDEITPENVRALRPAGGEAPHRLGDLIGLRFTTDCEPGTPLTAAVYGQAPHA